MRSHWTDQLPCCCGHEHLGNIDWLTGWKWDPTDELILPFAFAGSLGRCDCRNSSLVESCRYFVDVVQCEEGEYQAGTEREKRIQMIKYNTIRDYSVVWTWYRNLRSAEVTYHVVTQTRCTRPEANSDRHRHNRTGDQENEWHKWETEPGWYTEAPILWINPRLKGTNCLNILLGKADMVIFRYALMINSADASV